MNEDLKVYFERAVARAEERSWIPGLLGAIAPDGSVKVESDRVGFVHVRVGPKGAQGTSIARNLGVALTPNMPVRMRRENGILVVYGISNVQPDSESPLPPPISGGSYGEGYGIDIVSNTISVDTADIIDNNKGLYQSSGLDIGILLDATKGPGLEVDANGLRVSTSLAGDGLTMVDETRQLHIGKGNGIFVGVDEVAVDLANVSGLRFELITDKLMINLKDNSALEMDVTGVALGPPQTLAWNSANTRASSKHWHAILSEWDVSMGRPAILRSDEAGLLHLRGLRVDQNVLYVDSATNNVGVNKTPDGSTALWVQSSNINTVTQRLRQIPDQRERIWRVDNASGHELIVLDSVGNLQSGNPGFVSGLTGWQITPDGTAEFNHGIFRGELHSTIFTKDEVHATGGTLLIATAGNLKYDAVISLAAGDELDVLTESVTEQLVFVSEGEARPATMGAPRNLIDIVNPPSGLAQIFNVGDVLRTKTISMGTGLHVYDVWMTVTEVEQRVDENGDDYFRYYVEYESGILDGSAYAIIPALSTVVSYGQAGDGRLLLTSDMSYAPYMDVFTVGATPWEAGGTIPHVRVGRLDGVGVSGVSGIEQYGMIAGSDLSDNDSPYLVASNLQLKLYKVQLESWDGLNPTARLTPSGDFRLGTDVDEADATALHYDPVADTLTLRDTDLNSYYLTYHTFQLTDQGFFRLGSDLDPSGFGGEKVMFDPIFDTYRLGSATGHNVTLDGSTGVLSVEANIELDTLNHIRTSGKDSFADTTAGFFLGWSTDAYKFNLGDANSFLKWDGATLSIQTLNDSILFQDTDLVLKQTLDTQALIKLQTSAYGATQELVLKLLVGNISTGYVDSVGDWVPFTINSVKHINVNGSIVAGGSSLVLAGFDIHSLNGYIDTINADDILANTYYVRKELRFEDTAEITVYDGATPVAGLNALGPLSLFAGEEVQPAYATGWGTFGDAGVSGRLRYYRSGRLINVYGWVQMTSAMAPSDSGFPFVISNDLPKPLGRVDAPARVPWLVGNYYLMTAWSVSVQPHTSPDYGSLHLEVPPAQGAGTWGTNDWDVMFNFFYITDE